MPSDRVAVAAIPRVRSAPGRSVRRRAGSIRPGIAGLLLSALVAGCRTVETPTFPPARVAAEAAAPLTHDDCIRLAAESVPNAAVWSARAATIRAALRGARVLPNPSLNAGWEDLALNSAAAGPVQTTLTLSAALADLFSRGRRIAAAKHAASAEASMLLAERAELATRVRDAYDELVALRRRVALLRASEAAARDSAAKAGRFVTSGLRGRAAAAKAEVDVLAVAFAREKAEGEARAAELAFAFALGFDRPTAIALAEPMTLAHDPPADLEALLTEAAESRPEIAAAKARTAAALESARLEAERIRIFPGFETGPRFVGPARSLVASLQVELPVFDDGSAAEDAASAELWAAAAELRRVAHGVSAEVATSRHRLEQAARVTLPGTTGLLERRKRLTDDVRRLFAAGEAELDQVFDAESDARAAELDVLEAELEVAKAANALRRAVGRDGVSADLRRDQIAPAERSAK